MECINIQLEIQFWSVFIIYVCFRANSIHTPTLQLDKQYVELVQVYHRLWSIISCYRYTMHAEVSILVVILNGKLEAVSVLRISLEYIASILQQKSDTLGMAILSSNQKWRFLWNYRKRGISSRMLSQKKLVFCFH